MTHQTPATFKLFGVPEPVAEFVFHPTRKWRFDFAWPDAKVALEVEGGTWRKGGGAHRGTGFLRDLEKYNCATILGWRIFRCTPEQLQTSEIANMILEAIGLPRREDDDGSEGFPRRNV